MTKSEYYERMIYKEAAALNYAKNITMDLSQKAVRKKNKASVADNMLQDYHKKQIKAVSSLDGVNNMVRQQVRSMNQISGASTELTVAQKAKNLRRYMERGI